MLRSGNIVDSRTHTNTDFHCYNAYAPTGDRYFTIRKVLAWSGARDRPDVRVSSRPHLSHGHICRHSPRQPSRFDEFPRNFTSIPSTYDS